MNCDYMDIRCSDISCDLCEKIQIQAYNKAIDDFVNNIKDELNCFEVKNLDTCVLFDFINSKAEQLKERNQNEQSI